MTAVLVKLVNASLGSATFPSAKKHAIVTQIVKKPGVDLSSLSSYRPIAVCLQVTRTSCSHQLTTYINMNHLAAHQSAYRRHHSSETALLSVCNDAILAADRGMVIGVNPAGDAVDVSHQYFDWWGHQWECPHQYLGWLCSGI